jgi:hypothetical protein
MMLNAIAILSLFNLFSSNYLFDNLQTSNVILHNSMGSAMIPFYSNQNICDDNEDFFCNMNNVLLHSIVFNNNMNKNISLRKISKY